MLPLPWPDINWLISFDNELLFTLRKLPRGNYGILKLNSEEDPFITFKDCEGGTDPLFTASLSSEMLGQFLRKIQSQQHSFDNSEAEASQTTPPHCSPVPPTSVPAEPPPPAQCRPSCLRLLQLLSLPGLHCSSFLLLSEKSFKLTERGVLWPNGRDIRCFTTSLPTGHLLTQALPCLLTTWAPSLAWPSHPSHLPGSGQQLEWEGRNQDDPKFHIVSSLHRPATPHYSSGSICKCKSHLMIIFHCRTFLINKSCDNDNVYTLYPWLSLSLLFAQKLRISSRNWVLC